MRRTAHIFKLVSFFLLGAASTALVLISLSYLVFTATFRGKIYPGVKIDNRPAETFLTQPKKLGDLNINLTHPKASVSAKASEINLRFDATLMRNRALSIGRQTKNPYYNFLQILASWQGKINLPIELAVDQDALNKKIDVVAPLVEKKPVDAVFKFSPGAGPDARGRVVAFTRSENGIAIDRGKLKEDLVALARIAYQNQTTSTLALPIPTKTLLPAIESSTADQMGIKTLLGRGESYFYDSIPGRVYNINLGSQKINGSLIAPNEVFSFDTAIGTVSAVFGFAKAYAIKEGKTVLDDGGGVCQVSTTLYRAVLNAGLPVIERVAHTYRVGFYEQGGFLPGLDATVYPPSPDFKFKNDTGGYVLIQTTFDPGNAKLTFDLFGTDDGRKTQIQGPFFISTSPPPDPIYEDDPTLPVGEVKQVDTAHAGAKVYFKRTVTRGNDTLINETVYSDFVPWPARYLRGTKT